MSSKADKKAHHQREPKASNSRQKEAEASSSTESDASDEKPATWESIGLSEPLVKACQRLGWKKPSSIQAQAIPWALQKRDVIGVAQTGSGKTAAFALPILENLLRESQGLFALILSPTRYVPIPLMDLVPKPNWALTSEF